MSQACLHGSFRSLLQSLRRQALLLPLCCALAVLGACGQPEVGGDALGTFTSDAAGFDTHSYYYDTGREVVVFDAQFTEELAQSLIAEIRSHTKSPIRYVVITHPNPDKFNGAVAFQAIGAQVVASQATAQAIAGVYAYKKYYFINVAKRFTEATYPPQARIDQTFQGRWELPLEGAARVILSELVHPGVSTTQTVAQVPAIGALIVGDLVHANAHAWLEGGIRDGKPHPDLAAWKLALGELAALPGATDDTVVYGGRGDRTSLANAVPAQMTYLTAMETLVSGYVRDLGSRRSELTDPTLAPAHYKQLATLGSQAFPSYALPYLIEYGVYGLVNSIAFP